MQNLHSIACTTSSARSIVRQSDDVLVKLGRPVSYITTRTSDDPYDPYGTYTASLPQRQQRQQQRQQQSTSPSQRLRPQPSSSSGSIRTLRRTPKFEQQGLLASRPFLAESDAQDPTPSGSGNASRPLRATTSSVQEGAFWPQRTVHISRRTASAIIFALEEGIRRPYRFSPVTAEENASMADIGGVLQGTPTTNGRAQNGGSRLAAGPVPVPQNSSERVRTPTDILRDRRARESTKREASDRQREQEAEARRLAQMRKPATAGVAQEGLGDIRRNSRRILGTEKLTGENDPADESGRRSKEYRNPLEDLPPSRQQRNTSSSATQPGPSQRLPQDRVPDANNIPQPTSTRRRAQSQSQTIPTRGKAQAPRIVSQPQPGTGQASTAAATFQSQPKPSGAGPAPRNANTQDPTSVSQQRSTTTSSFPHAFERWEQLSSHWEGLTSFWIRRLQQNKDEIDKNPLNSQLARQVNDLSAAGANLFHAVVELQRLRASSERKFQRWFFETKAESEKANEVRAGLEEALRQERSAKADAVAALTRVETDKNSAYQNRSTAEQMVKEMRRELQISKEEARRAWEELGRREQEERDRTLSLKNGQPTLVGGVQVVPMLQGAASGQASTNRPSTREGPVQPGHSARSGPESLGSPIAGDLGYTNYDPARSDTDTDPFTESGRARPGQGIPPLPNTIPQPHSTSNASAAALQAAQSAAFQSDRGSSQPATTSPQSGTYLRYGPGMALGQPSPSFYQHEGSSLLPEGQQPRTTEADERSFVPSVDDTNSQEEYEMNSNGEVQRDGFGRPIPYRGDLGSDDSDEYDVQEQLERERMYGQQYGSGISGVEYGSGSTSTAGAPPQQADYSGSGYGAAPEWEAVPRHHHPTRLSDVLEEDERTNRTSPSRASQR